MLSYNARDALLAAVRRWRLHGQMSIICKEDGQELTAAGLIELILPYTGAYRPTRFAMMLLPEEGNHA